MANKDDSSRQMSARQPDPPSKQMVWSILRIATDYLVSRSAIAVVAAVVAFVYMRMTALPAESIAFIQEQIILHRVEIIVASFLSFLAGLYYFLTRPRRIFLVDFSVYLPPSELELTIQQSKDFIRNLGVFDEQGLSFQNKVVDRSGLGDRTSFPPACHNMPFAPTMANARKEAEMVLYSAMDDLLKKTGVKPRDISVLVVNCSLFCPTPSLSAMIVRKYEMRDDIQSYSLGGMGCSAGVIAVKVASDLLQTHRGYAVVLSSENMTQNFYAGNKRSMQVTNCLFREGGAAVLLSSYPRDWLRAKYELATVERTHMGGDDRSYGCVMQEEDDEGIRGVSLSKDLMQVAGSSLKQNITKLGPRVLPLSEQLAFACSLIARKFLHVKMPAYVPDFKTAFEHVCIHAGGRGVLDEIQKGLSLSDWYMEPSRMSLCRFGNTSSASIWYELSYLEAKGRVSRGDRVWQIAFGSGFKCNSAVWKALRAVNAAKNLGPWADCIDQMPVQLQEIA